MRGDSDEEAQEAAGPDEGSNSLFIVHKLSKMDTLAGLAIKYHVTVADIKRSNSLLSDSAMFARDSLRIPTRPLPMGQEYSAWAGMIVSQYGQITRHGQSRPGRPFCSGDAPAESRLSAIDQLRAHYGLSPATSPTAGSGRGYAHSEDGFSSGRPGPAEVELSDMAPSPRSGLPRRPSLPELNGYAGERSGPPPGDERLRRRRAGEGDEAWGSADSAAGSGGLHAGHILPPGGNQSPERTRRRPPLFQMPEAAAPGRGGTAGAARAGSAGLPQLPGRRRESFLDRVKRAASQPALAGPSGPSLASLAGAAIASVKRPPSESGTRALLHDAAAVLQGPKDTQKKE